jgi:DNA topoisomerase VI subunit B
VQGVNWKSYGLNQSRGALPVGPLTIVVHISSVWVPFTSESKEAIAHYNELIDEIKLALQEAGRQLAKYTVKKSRVSRELKKRSFIQKYMSHVATGLKEILDLDKADEEMIVRNLEIVLEQTRGEIDDMKFDPTKNTEFDEEWAKIGKDENDESNDEDDTEREE